MDKQEAVRVITKLIDFIEKNGFEEFQDTLYSLLDAVNEEIEEEVYNA